MPRDYPDGAAPIYQVAVKQTDLGQLFLAMTGFQPLDTRGRMVWLDTFQEGIARWELAASGDGAVPIVDTAYPFVGSLDSKMNSGTLAGVGMSAQRIRLFSDFGQRVGFEFGLRYASGTGRIVTNIYWLRPGTQSRGRLTIRPEDGEILVGPDTALVSVGNVGAAGATALWLPVKFVVDFDTEKLVRVMVANTLIDLSDYDTISTTLTGNWMLICEVDSYGWGTGDKLTYLGYGMVTLDEP
jgi:hypothetical protein